LEADRHTACVIAQQYSSATFHSLPFHSSQGINTGGFKNYISKFLFLIFKKIA
jgi:hypothetical protein